MDAKTTKIRLAFSLKTNNSSNKFQYDTEVGRMIW